jgi:CRP/FNR family transcriptional regulator
MLMPLETFKVTCANCNLRELLCMTSGLSPADLAKIDMFPKRKVKLGELLFSSGQPFTAFYAIQTGFFKTSVTATDGREQVTGFQMAGEMMGLDGIGGDCYSCDAIALEASHVCVIPYAHLNALAHQMPALHTQLHKIMSREIAREHDIMLLLGSMRADERIAAFLLNLSQRMYLRGFSRSDLVLRMSRKDIGSYLGLKLETVSRAFSRLAEQGILEVKQRNVHICDAEALGAMLDAKAPPRGARRIDPPLTQPVCSIETRF